MKRRKRHLTLIQGGRTDSVSYGKRYVMLSVIKNDDPYFERDDSTGRFDDAS